MNKLKNSFNTHDKYCIKKKLCYLVDYKNINILLNYLSLRGKILPRKISKLTNKKQRLIKIALKRARTLSLLSFDKIQ
uniref:Small ribosomal subunit protein bS18c n=1 Tax=Epipogium roseum TaxID=556037 RepID=A0A0B4N593_9ASPA|nr:ribosomal protein S18 [Epipogium roseum]